MSFLHRTSPKEIAKNIGGPSVVPQRKISSPTNCGICLYWYLFVLVSTFVTFLCSGGESIHREFKTLTNNHASMNDPVQRLRSVMKRHHLNVFPMTSDKRPETKRRGPYKKKLDPTTTKS